MYKKKQKLIFAAKDEEVTIFYTINGTQYAMAGNQVQDYYEKQGRRSYMNEFEVYAEQGWQCPICKRVYSPTTPMCFYCGEKETTITSTYEIKLPYPNSACEDH